MTTGPIGQYFDNADDLFSWANNALLGLLLIRMANQSGIMAQLIDGPASLDELAAASGVPADKLGRIMDFLVAHELIDAGTDGMFHATARTTMAHDAASFFRMVDFRFAAGAQLLPALEAGKTPFELALGRPVFDYFASHPADAADFGEFMGWMTRRGERFLFEHHKFQPFRTVADIGGSGGGLLMNLLDQNPGTRGILFELPDVVERARPLIEASPLAERIDLVGGSFFNSAPAADLYLLKQILHDWNDDECRTILGNIRNAIAPDGRVAVIDHLLSEKPAPDESQTTDIFMMLWSTGHERKRPEMEALLISSGFRVDRVTANPAGHSVVEAVPV